MVLDLYVIHEIINKRFRKDNKLSRDMKQIVIKLSNECDSSFGDFINYVNQQYAYGYPIVLPSGIEYNVIDVGDKILFSSSAPIESKTDKIRDALKNKDDK